MSYTRKKRRGGNGVKRRRDSFQTPPRRLRRRMAIPIRRQNGNPAIDGIHGEEEGYLQRRYINLQNIRRNLANDFSTGIIARMNSPNSIAAMDPFFYERMGGRNKKSRKSRKRKLHKHTGGARCKCNSCCKKRGGKKRKSRRRRKSRRKSRKRRRR